MQTATIEFATGKPAKQVTLADVYSWAFDGRTEDLQMWQMFLNATHKPQAVIEVGCGTGRLVKHLHEFTNVSEWMGIEYDAEMVAQFFENTASLPAVGVTMGDAALAGTWTRALAAMEPVDAVVIPYSTLFLLGHSDQMECLRNAFRALRKGGRVAVEIFRNDKGSGSHTNWDFLTGPDGKTWKRTSYYEVDTSNRRTSIKREYSIYGSPQVEYVLHENLHWCYPRDLTEMISSIGFSVARTSTKYAPDGQVLVTGRK